MVTLQSVVITNGGRITKGGGHVIDLGSCYIYGHVTVLVVLHVSEGCHVTMWSCYMGLHGGHITWMVMLEGVVMLQCGHVTWGYMGSCYMDGHITEGCHVTMYVHRVTWMVMLQVLVTLQKVRYDS